LSFEDGTVLTDGGNVWGATTPNLTLTLAGVSTNDLGPYSAIARDAYGTIVRWDATACSAAANASASRD
jgi:hypothetical protein